MSTDYRPLPDILFAQLFDGRPEKYGVREKISAHSTEVGRYLEGYDGVLLAYRAPDGTCGFEQRGRVPWSIFDALIEEFQIESVSEHDHRFWGFSTEEEWDAFHKESARDGEDQFYNDLLRYLRDEQNVFRLGTIGMIRAEIAKTLIQSNPGFAAPEKRDVLLEAVRAIYDRDHSVTITLTEEDLAALGMVIARTDDLSKA
jgi:hypothetical protein